MDNFEKFYNMAPMKYYDCSGNYESPKAQTMIQNEGNHYIATLKSDGEWGRLIVDTDGMITIQSRSISKVTGEYGDKTGQLPQIVLEAKQTLPPQTVLLGEICFNNITTTSRDVGSILRCLPAKAIARQDKGEHLYFKVFDCLAVGGIDLMDSPFIDRFEAALDMLGKVDHTYIMPCKYVTENFEDFLATILRNGGEGIVIHSKEYLYAPGKRPAWSTLKVKKSTGELEVPVVGTTAPTREYTGIEREAWPYWEGTYDDGQTVLIDHTPGNIDMEYGLTWTPVTKPYYKGWRSGIVVNHNGNMVRVASGLTDEDRAWLATDEAAKAIAEGTLVAVVSGMEITEDSIRHPRLIRLRTDIQEIQ